MRKILLLIILLISWKGFSQSTNGMSGLIHIPSARMLEDGQLVIGAAYIPEPYFKLRNNNINPGLNTYITYGILPFIEIMFRYSHELNIPVNPETEYFPDRMFGFRARFLNETKYFPSIVIGLQDSSGILGDTCLGCSNFSANYLVGSKNFRTELGDFDLTLGYSFDIYEINYEKDYIGVFGGISFTPDFYKNASIIFEHNSK